VAATDAGAAATAGAMSALFSRCGRLLSSKLGNTWETSIWEPRPIRYHFGSVSK
jgi:hypothetical protein